MKLIIILLLLSLISIINSTPLDDYINTPDSSYKWTLNNTISNGAYTAYFLELTSQTWMTTKESNSPLWKHWVTICVPTGFKSNKTILYIDAGDDNSPNWTVPTQVDQTVELVCTQTGSVSVGVYQIPNQPIIFDNDGVPRVEDNLIAYTWGKYLKGNATQPLWLARLPMTKAVIRAMDAIQEFGKTINYNTNQFVVLGASKRGWVAWLTSIVDKRVIAIVPITMPILNMIPNWGHQFYAYGEWSFSLLYYINQGVMDYFVGPQMKSMASIIDPFSYLDRINVPIYTIMGTGDDFFITDSASFFWSNLTSEKHFRLVANTDHSLQPYTVDVITSIVTFAKLIVSETPRPQFSWETIYSNDLNSATILLKFAPGSTEPSVVNLWQAVTASSTKRDFRQTICITNTPNCTQSIIWNSTELEPTTTEGVYSVTLSKPPTGWLGFFIETVFNLEGENFPLKFTSEVAIVPNTLPFGSCVQYGACGNGTFTDSSDKSEDESDSSSNKTNITLFFIVISILVTIFL